MTKLHIRDSFWLMLAAGIFLDEQQLLPVFLSASTVHEAGHWIAVRLCGGQIRAFRLSAAGGLMTYRLRAPCAACDAVIALSGPAAGLLLALAANLNGWFSLAGASLLLSLFNLLPIPPLDGGRALEILLPFPAVRRVLADGCALCVLLTGLSAALCRNGWGLCMIGLFLVLSRCTDLQLHAVRGKI